MSASFSVARVSRDDEAKLPQIRHGWHRREYGEGGGGSGLRETAADESRKETADRVAKYQTDYYVGRTCLCYTLVLFYKLLRLPRSAFVVPWFSCPFLSLLVVLFINTSYQNLPFGSGDYPDKLLHHQALN